MDTGIDIRVEEVDEQVRQGEQRREGQHDALHHRVVASEDRVDQEQPKPRPAEHRFGEDRPAEQGAELEPDGGDDRDERVAEGVTPEDRPLGEALGPRRAYVVLPEHLEYARPRHARDEGHREGAQSEGGSTMLAGSSAPAAGSQLRSMAKTM